MFTPIRKDLFRWGTPDPDYDWMMFGHVIVGEEGCVLVDPPHVPGLLDNVLRMGKLESVILTTLDHSRGSAYIVEKTGASLLIPDQTSDDVDPMAMRLLKQVKDHETYREGKVLGITAHRLKVDGDRSIGMPSMNEFALLTDHGELLVGDFVTASADGMVLPAPEWFPSDKQPQQYVDGRKKFSSLVETTGAVSLLTSHGDFILGNLQEQASKL